MDTTTRHTTVPGELLRWLLFSVLLSLVPLALRAFLPTLFHNRISYVELLKDGELLLVGVGLAGAALSDILVARRDDAMGQLALFGGIGCIVIGSFSYAAILIATNVNPEAVVKWSIGAFIASVAIGGGAVVIREAAK